MRLKRFRRETIHGSVVGLMRRRGWARASLLTAATLHLAGPAQGSEIRDGAEFSVTIPSDTHPCFLFPEALFDRAACPPDAKPLASVPLGERASALAVGSVGLDDGGRVTLVATRVAGGDVSRPSDLAAFARGMAEQMATSRPGVKVHGTPEASFVQVDGLSLVRASFDLDRLYDNGRAHEVGFTTLAQSGTYAISLTGLAAHASTIDALAYHLIATLRVAHPAPFKAAPSREYLLGRAVGTALVPTVAIVGLVVFLWRDRRKRRRGPSIHG